MTDSRVDTKPEQARGGRSRRARSAVMANYIHEISTRNGRVPRLRVELPAVGYTRPLAADSVGCA